MSGGISRRVFLRRALIGTGLLATSNVIIPSFLCGEHQHSFGLGRALAQSSSDGEREPVMVCLEGGDYTIGADGTMALFTR